MKMSMFLAELAIRMWKVFVDECHRLTDAWRKHVNPCFCSTKMELNFRIVERETVADAH